MSAIADRQTTVLRQVHAICQNVPCEYHRISQACYVESRESFRRWVAVSARLGDIFGTTDAWPKEQNIQSYERNECHCS